LSQAELRGKSRAFRATWLRDLGMTEKVLNLHLSRSFDNGKIRLKPPYVAER